METNNKKKHKETKRRTRIISSRLTGEDIAMFNERKYENEKKNKKNICDSHIDGA